MESLEMHKLWRFARIINTDDAYTGMKVVAAVGSVKKKDFRLIRGEIIGWERRYITSWIFVVEPMIRDDSGEEFHAWAVAAPDSVPNVL